MFMALIVKDKGIARKQFCSFKSIINIRRCGVSANETTLHPNNNLKK